MSNGHDHPDDDGEQAAGWFRALDVIVWMSVAVIVIVGAEWLGGLLVRERIARSARKYLDRVDELRNRNNTP